MAVSELTGRSATVADLVRTDRTVDHTPDLAASSEGCEDSLPVPATSPAYSGFPAPLDAAASSDSPGSLADGDSNAG